MQCLTLLLFSLAATAHGQNGVNILQHITGLTGNLPYLSTSMSQNFLQGLQGLQSFLGSRPQQNYGQQEFSYGQSNQQFNGPPRPQVGGQQQGEYQQDYERPSQSGYNRPPPPPPPFGNQQRPPPPFQQQQQTSEQQFTYQRPQGYDSSQQGYAGFGGFEVQQNNGYNQNSRRDHQSFSNSQDDLSEEDHEHSDDSEEHHQHSDESEEHEHVHEEYSQDLYNPFGFNDEDDDVYSHEER